MVFSFLRKKKKAPPVPQKDVAGKPQEPAQAPTIKPLPKTLRNERPGAKGLAKTPAERNLAGITKSPGIAARNPGSRKGSEKSNLSVSSPGANGPGSRLTSGPGAAPNVTGSRTSVSNGSKSNVSNASRSNVSNGSRSNVSTGSGSKLNAGAALSRSGSGLNANKSGPGSASGSVSEKDPFLDSGLISGSSKKFLPPRINTDQPVLLAPSSPLSAKSASSFSRHPPASFIRHSRVLSGSSTFGGLNEMFSPLKTLRHRQREIITDLPHQLSPVVNLLNAQRLRQYAAGPLSVLGADGALWLPADAVLTGTELSIWVIGASKPRYLNIQDCTILPSSYHVPGDELLFDVMILQDYDCNLASLRFTDSAEMHTWLAALHLAKFEQTSLNEAFTAVVLSLKGPQLSDVYTLLAHKKRFARFEWCNLRLPQISNKWIKVFMAIIPSDSKKNGRVEMYTSEKLNKKNLVLYVNQVNSAYNVYPEDHHMIDFNLIMKLEGEVFVNKLYEHLFGGESSGTYGSGVGTLGDSSPKRVLRPNSVTSLSSFTAPQPVPFTGRSRSTSLSSALSFFVNAPSPNPESSPKKDKKSHFFKKQAVNNFVTTSYIYLMPDLHPGVSAIEIMLRNFVHIIDAFKLYGRPDHFSSSKTDPASLLFGLPSLPHFCYMDSEDAFGVVGANFDTARLSDWGEREWRKCLKEFLSCLQQDGNFKGSGDINDLFRSVEAQSPESSVVFGDVSPYGILRVGSPREITFPVGSPEMPKSGTPPDELGSPIELPRPLHPIVDLPTPSDDRNAYFQEKLRKDGRSIEIH